MQDPNPLPWGALDRFQAQFIVRKNAGSSGINYTAKTSLKTKGHFGSKVITKVESDVGPIEVLVYNLGAQTGMKLLSQTTHKEFEWGCRMASFGLFRVAKVLCPIMAERGKGTFVVTSATAAMRGNATQHSHAAAMGARRML